MNDLLQAMRCVKTLKECAKGVIDMSYLEEIEESIQKEIETKRDGGDQDGY